LWVGIVEGFVRVWRSCGNLVERDECRLGPVAALRASANAYVDIAGRPDTGGDSVKETALLNDVDPTLRVNAKYRSGGLGSPLSGAVALTEFEDDDFAVVLFLCSYFFGHMISLRRLAHETRTMT